MTIRTKSQSKHGNIPHTSMLLPLLLIVLLFWLIAFTGCEDSPDSHDSDGDGDGDKDQETGDIDLEHDTDDPESDGDVPPAQTEPPYSKSPGASIEFAYHYQCPNCEEDPPCHIPSWNNSKGLTLLA